MPRQSRRNGGQAIPPSGPPTRPLPAAGRAAGFRVADPRRRPRVRIGDRCRYDSGAAVMRRIKRLRPTTAKWMAAPPGQTRDDPLDACQHHRAAAACPSRRLATQPHRSPIRVAPMGLLHRRADATASGVTSWPTRSPCPATGDASDRRSLAATSWKPVCAILAEQAARVARYLHDKPQCEPECTVRVP